MFSFLFYDQLFLCAYNERCGDERITIHAREKKQHLRYVNLINVDLNVNITNSCSSPRIMLGRAQLVDNGSTLTEINDRILRELAVA